ncbi:MULTISPECIES: CPBP family intramembrane glutamic endopeptidase [Myxococcaceae]|uniref:CPBP family intramembrane glutamic endopeptidase n=1 Tax=Myxococcaceae TaxID=31 RepID=UPI00188F6AF4|nr:MULTISPECIES: CPBP family intramembrane glutamic endopeptidase [Myxococcaceae]MBF5041863.1 CPBP family intramembrane metalloprotease [Simulacricoccus sp. 17bor-14]
MLPESAAPAVPAAPVSRPRVWPSLLSYLLLMVGMLVGSALFFGAWLAAQAASAYVAGQSHDQVLAQLREQGMSVAALPLVMALSSLVTVLVQLACALLPAALSPTPWRERLGLVPAGRPKPGALGVACVGILSLGWTMSCVASLLGARREGGPLEMLEALARRASTGEFLLMLVVMAAGAGLAEELFFRGYLQTRLVARWGRGVGIGLTALLFGLMHLNPLHAVLATGVGAFLGWVRERSGSVHAGIVAHAVNNAVAFATSRTWSASTPSRESLAWGLLVYGGIFGACLLFLRRARWTEPSAPRAPLPDVAGG